jgi:antitoxin component YwqK of YwqJK toxin-antitoxin module
MRIFYQKNVPVSQQIIYRNEKCAMEAPIGDLDIHCNDDTGLIFNRAFDPDKVVAYSEDYDNNQSYSSVFSTYMDTQTKWLMNEYIQKDAIVIEIGCGQGEILEDLQNI